MLRRTKILTTLGPATDNPKVLGEMLRAGADVVRVNFSHGEAAEALHIPLGTVKSHVLRGRDRLREVLGE